MDGTVILTATLGIALVLTALRAIAHGRYILALSLLCLLGIPLTRFGIVPREIGYIFNNIGAFGIMYKLNWYLNHYVDPVESSEHDGHRLDAEKKK